MEINFNIKASDLFTTEDLRMDVNYWIENHKTDSDFIKFSDLFQIVKEETPKFNDLPEEFEYCQIGNLTKDGKVIPITINKASIDDEEDEDSKVYKKIFEKNGDDYKLKDITSVNENDILISKVRPALNKILFIAKNDYIDYSAYYYTKAFIRVKCINENVEPVLCYYILKTLLNKELIAVSRIGKSGYPAIKENDLLNLRIPVSIADMENEQLNKEVKELYIKNLELEFEAHKKQKENIKIIQSKMNKLKNEGEN